MKPLDESKLKDDVAERIRRSHHEAIEETQRRVGNRRVVRNVVLFDNVLRSVPHGLGRKPTFVGISAVRGATAAGVVVDHGAVWPSGEAIDRTKSVVLHAAFYGATITVDILFEVIED